jgi:hypothetical protein
MKFIRIVGICLDFSIANGGTIQSYPEKFEKLMVHSRTARTEILVERVADACHLELKQNAVGDKTSVKQVVSTEEKLLEYLSRFWYCEADSGLISELSSDASLLANEEPIS